MPPQWRCSPHQSAKVSSLCLRAKDHLEGTKVAVFWRYCAPQKVQTGSAAAGGHRGVATRKATGDLTTRAGGRRPRGGRWWDTDEATREEGPVQASAVVLHDDTGRGSRVRLPPAQPSEATDTAVPQLCPAHAKRRSTSRLALCIKVDQQCGRSASEEVASNFIAGRFSETAMLRALCARVLHFHLTPCLRAVGKTLGQDRRFCSASIAALRRRCPVFSVRCQLDSDGIWS